MVAPLPPISESLAQRTTDKEAMRYVVESGLMTDISLSVDEKKKRLQRGEGLEFMARSGQIKTERRTAGGEEASASTHEVVNLSEAQMAALDGDFEPDRVTYKRTRGRQFSAV